LPFLGTDFLFLEYRSDQGKLGSLCNIHLTIQKSLYSPHPCIVILDHNIEAIVLEKSLMVRNIEQRVLFKGRNPEIYGLRLPRVVSIGTRRRTQGRPQQPDKNDANSENRRLLNLPHRISFSETAPPMVIDSAFLEQDQEPKTSAAGTSQRGSWLP
jgi:hypothetical protein